MSSNIKPLPPTKDGYRYSYCEDDIPLCNDYIADFYSYEANKRLNHPIIIKRKLIPTSVKLSESDKAPQLKLSEDNLRVTGDKGYSMVRATHCTNRGTFYFEATIEGMPEGSAARIGWGQAYANLQAPLGYDFYGYSWRSRFGTRFHQARGKSFDDSGGYSKGDTIGCMIELPYGNENDLIEAHHLPESIKKRSAVLLAKKKDAATKVMEEHDNPPSLSTMETIAGSRISFYKNGKFVGVAFEDIFAGYYYPSISLYKNCVVSANFGPRFKCPPKSHTLHEVTTNNTCHSPTYRPFQDIVEVSIIDHLMTDLLFIVDKEFSEKGKQGILDEIRTGVIRPD